MYFKQSKIYYVTTVDSEVPIALINLLQTSICNKRYEGVKSVSNRRTQTGVTFCTLVRTKNLEVALKVRSCVTRRV